MTLAKELQHIPQGLESGSTWERFLREVFSSIDPQDGECRGCRHLHITPDAYGTGDSPEDHECRNASKVGSGCMRMFDDECDAGMIAKRIYEEGE